MRKSGRYTILLGGYSDAKAAMCLLQQRNRVREDLHRTVAYRRESRNGVLLDVKGVGTLGDVAEWAPYHLSRVVEHCRRERRGIELLDRNSYAERDLD